MIMQMVSDARKDTLIFTYKVVFFKLLNTHPPVSELLLSLSLCFIIIIIIIIHHPAQNIDILLVIITIRN